MYDRIILSLLKQKQTPIQMTIETKTIEQSNFYNIIYSNGKASKIYIVASNINEAKKEAKKRENEIGSVYYKIKRCYNGGVRG